MWLEEYHVDGLRTDAISFIRNVNGANKPEEDIPDGWSLMQWINKEVQQRFPWKITIAEDMQCNEWITKPQQADGEGFSTQWDAAFVYPIRRALRTTKDADRHMDEIAKAIMTRYNDDAFERVIFTESHDEVANGKVRVPEEIAPNDSTNWYAKKRSILGAVALFTSPGIPIIFMGQELFENGWFSDYDPLDWSKFNQFKGISKLYRDLIHLRTNAEGQTKGLTGQHAELLYINNTEKIIAYHRSSNEGSNDSVVIVLNFADRDHNDLIIPFPEPGLWKLRFNSDWKGYDPDFGNEFAWDTATLECDTHDNKYDARVNIAPYSAVIYSKD
jgi:1,4-alpha-glucan branching enzyme